MKRVLRHLAFVLASASIMTGCGLAWSTHYFKNYNLNEIKSARVGDQMITYKTARINDVYKTIGDGFGQELIYGGIANGIVKVMYREYGGPGASYARPAFNQELQYDMNASKIITYRSLKIEVIEYSNEVIRYKVIEGPKLPENVKFDDNEPF